MNDELADGFLPQIFGMKRIFNEPNAPPVDFELLKILVYSDEIEQEAFGTAITYLEKYKTWRDAFDALMLEKLQNKLNSRLEDYPGSSDTSPGHRHDIF